MATKVRSDYGEGQAGISTKTASMPKLADILRGLVDDVAARTPATIASADAVAAAGANPTKAEFDAVVTLVNEIKAALNAASAAALEVEKA